MCKRLHVPIDIADAFVLQLLWVGKFMQIQSDKRACNQVRDGDALIIHVIGEG